MLLSCNAIAVKLESLVVHDAGGKVSITCAFNGPFKYKAFMLYNPARFVLDFEQTSSTHPLQNILTHHDLIKTVRVGYQNNHSLRVVFDANDGVILRQVPSKAMRPQQRILQIDLVQNNPSQRSDLIKRTWVTPTVQKPTITKTISTKPGKIALMDAPARSLRVPSKPLRDVVVVLDPGHGGKDPGAIGMHKSAEKHVVLAIALKLKQLIDRQPGMRAVLTRNGDYYIGLRERMTIARHHNADIFVAIHADAFSNHNSNGASVFALSPRGATSEAARWLAEKENHSELGGVNLSGLDDQNGVIRTVLLDLSQTATIGASLQMGSRVLRGLDTVTTLHNARVEQARFVVLKSPDIPSILIETGFISNPREEQNLNSPAYQARLTQAIFQGLKGYFWDYPPHGTRVEAMAGGATHMVRSGERLQGIAQQYHVSVAQLRSANKLSGMNLTPGQSLHIPPSWG